MFYQLILLFFYLYTTLHVAGLALGRMLYVYKEGGDMKDNEPCRNHVFFDVVIYSYKYYINLTTFFRAHFFSKIICSDFVPAKMTSLSLLLFYFRRGFTSEDS